MDDDTLYLTITRGSEPRPIVATSDPDVLRAVAQALYAVLGGSDRQRVLHLRRELEPHPPAGGGAVGGSRATCELATIVAMATEARRDFQAHTSALNAIVSNLAAMNERLNHLPTREDLAKGLQQNRHDTRNAIQGMVKGDT